MDARRLIGIVHATQLAIAPASAACRSALGDPELWHLLDSRLLADLEASGELTPNLRRRFLRLVEHLVAEGVDGVLVTCSAYSFVACELRNLFDVPVVQPDAAMYRHVRDVRPDRIVLVASTEAAIAAAREQVHTSWDGDTTPVIVPVVVDDARRVARGDPQQLADVLEGPIRAARSAGVEAVVLTQYSLGVAAVRLQRALDVQIFTGADSAADELRVALETRPLIPRGGPSR